MTVFMILRHSAMLAVVLLLLGGCRDDEAAARARIEREIQQRVQIKVRKEVASQRLRTWRIVGFCALGAVAIGGLVWLGQFQSQSPNALNARDVTRRPIPQALLPGPASHEPQRRIQPAPGMAAPALGYSAVDHPTTPPPRTWPPPSTRVIDARPAQGRRARNRGNNNNNRSRSNNRRRGNHQPGRPPQ